MEVTLEPSLLGQDLFSDLLPLAPQPKSSSFRSRRPLSSTVICPAGCSASLFVFFTSKKPTVHLSTYPAFSPRLWQSPPVAPGWAPTFTAVILQFCRQVSLLYILFAYTVVLQLVFLLILNPHFHHNKYGYFCPQHG